MEEAVDWRELVVPRRELSNFRELQKKITTELANRLKR